MALAATIITAVVTLITSLTSSILVFKSEQKKIAIDHERLQNEQIEKQEKKMQDLEDNILGVLAEHKKTYVNEINNVHDSIAELRANSQQFQAVMEVRLEHMTGEFKDMKIEVREHNNFAKRMPVVEEQIKVANHRIEDLEHANQKKD